MRDRNDMEAAAVAKLQSMGATFRDGAWRFPNEDTPGHDMLQAMGKLIRLKSARERAVFATPADMWAARRDATQVWQDFEAAHDEWAKTDPVAVELYARLSKSAG